MHHPCFNCHENGTEFYGFIVCDTCKKELRLFTDKTVERHNKKITKGAYQKEVKDRLALLENVYIKKKIKLLDLLAKIEK